MNKILPEEILLMIFKQLSPKDVKSIYYSCRCFQSIIENSNLLKNIWTQLLNNESSKCCLTDQLSNLQSLDIAGINLSEVTFRLYDILSNKSTNLCFTVKTKCDFTERLSNYDYVVLKTHHSHLRLSFYKFQDPSFSFTPIVIKVSNEKEPTDVNYLQFRTIDKIIGLLHNYFYFHTQPVKRFVYIYPMKLCQAVKEDLICKIFEYYHISELILVPRVILLCETLEFHDAVVVYSTSRTTECAVVIQGSVEENRWYETNVGGWNVSENLCNTFRWIYPERNYEIMQFEGVQLKEYCWLKPTPAKHIATEKPIQLNKLSMINLNINDSEIIVLKDEQYLAAEMMYTELKLCSIIKHLLHGLSEDVQRKCLSHVLLVGGNCHLKYMQARVKLDLIKHFPQFENCLETITFNTRDVAYQIPDGALNEQMPSTFKPGAKCKLNIENYILGN